MMYWTQDESPETHAIPDDVADLLFAIECRRLPVDHAYSLSEALARVLPWMGEEPLLAVHSIHVAGSLNGWERPAHGPGAMLLPSRRTRLAIRAPRHRFEELLHDLPGKQLEVSGHPLRIGEGKVKPLSRETTLFSRYMVEGPDPDETAFLANSVRALGELGIRVRKALCGMSTALEVPGGHVQTRSLLLADLTIDESFRLQRLGLGPNRLMGCGVFIPHKGVEAAS